MINYPNILKKAFGYHILNAERGAQMSRPGCSVVKWTGGFVGRSRTRMSGGRGE